MPYYISAGYKTTLCITSFPISHHVDTANPATTHNIIQKPASQQNALYKNISPTHHHTNKGTSRTHFTLQHTSQHNALQHRENYLTTQTGTTARKIIQHNTSQNSSQLCSRICSGTMHHVIAQYVARRHNRQRDITSDIHYKTTKSRSKSKHYFLL